MFTKSRTQGFGKEVKRKIMLGTFVLSLEYYEKYYEKAQKLRRMILDEIDKILSDSDYILLPTTPTPAFNIGEIKTCRNVYAGHFHCFGKSHRQTCNFNTFVFEFR